MLANPKFTEWPEEKILEFVRAVSSEPHFPGHIKEKLMTEEEARQFIQNRINPERPEGHPVGIFFSWQLDLHIEKIKNEWPYGITRRQPDDKGNKRFAKLCGHESWELQSYGVCDNVKQILSRYLIAEIPDRKFCIGMALISKAISGWRWGKNGTYIGTHKIEYEYLSEEKNIEVVYSYHIYELE